MKEWYVSMRISAKASDARRKFFAKEKGAMKKKIGVPDLNDPVH